MTQATLTPHKINELNNFIMGWYFDDAAFCDEVVDYYNNSVPYKGVFGDGRVDQKYKDSYDVDLGNGPHAKKYIDNLQVCANAYAEKYRFCNEQASWTTTKQSNIQKYLPGGGFHAWHCERDGRSFHANKRHLVFMTYLNDVTDCGETEFYYQQLKVTPQKGLTLIWPVDWMFTHRGIASPSQEKIIVTGWFAFETENYLED
jgi:hypothetical protein